VHVRARRRYREAIGSRQLHPLPGDDVIPDAALVLDRARAIAAPPEAIWPWLVQLGKGRAGWYLPRPVERLVPRARRGARTLDPRWQALEPGRRIPDYGGHDAHLEVVTVDPPAALVYRSRRRSAEFSWALVLEPRGARETVVRLRLRATLRSRGLRRAAIVALGGLFDRVTSELMLAGLAERVRAAGGGDRQPGG